MESMENTDTRGVQMLGKNQMPVSATPREKKRTWKTMALEAILIAAATAAAGYGLWKTYESGERDMRERTEGTEQPARYDDSEQPKGIESRTLPFEHDNAPEERKIEENKPEGRANYQTNDFAKDDDKTLLARMLFGEARSCSEQEKVAIAYTVLNRANDGKKWNGTDVRSVILCPYQYSCFNQADPNRAKVMNPRGYDAKSWNECLRVAEEVLEGKYQDPTKGATHYHTLSSNPTWASSPKMEKIGRIGNSAHTFYREE